MNTKHHKKVGGRELRLFIVEPDGWKPTDRCPAMVFFHGGGWVHGAASQFNDQAAYLARRGMVCAQVEAKKARIEWRKP